MSIFGGWAGPPRNFMVCIKKIKTGTMRLKSVFMPNLSI